MSFRVTGILFFVILLIGCTKEETIVYDGNEPPIINNVPTVKIENYVNRIFIDLIGREPLDSEMDAEVLALKEADLAEDARIALIEKLQYDTTWRAGDTSYKRAYHQYMYDLAKIRCLEGASDRRIRQDRNLALNAAYRDSIEGNWSSRARNLEKAGKLQDVLYARKRMQAGEFGFNGVFAEMVDNSIYDIINMNTFNFVNATFDNLLWRYPTNAEFDAGYNIVEYNISSTLFGELGETKADYVRIITESNEMFEGMIIWAYQQLLARRPTTQETFKLLSDFYNHEEIEKVQQAIMATDEYANF